MLFMRYIRKHLAMLEEAKQNMYPAIPEAPIDEPADQGKVEVTYFPKKG